MLLSGNESSTYIAYKLNDILFYYPITPSSPMSEDFEKKALNGEKNIWGRIPLYEQMQSEIGVAGAIHGSLQTGVPTTTFTSSQGLLLMNSAMNRIAGELLPTVIHVASRSLGYQGGNIYGDHSDVMSLRHSGFAMLCSNNNQEIMDFSLIANTLTYLLRVPFIHFFDGFRSSHEIVDVKLISDEQIVKFFKASNFNNFYYNMPNNQFPAIRGAIYSSDIGFQVRETINKNYDRLPIILQKLMNKFEKLTGRSYKIFEYYGEKEATKLIIIMGSASECVKEAVDIRNSKYKDCGVLKVRLFRPFCVDFFIKEIPKTITHIAVLDRTKEIGAVGEPLYQEVCSAFIKIYSNKKLNSNFPLIIHGRYGLSSKDFTPNMALSVFNELDKKNPKNTFTIGIEDDKLGLKYTNIEFKNDLIEVLFYGLGSDRTISTVKLIINNIFKKKLYTQTFFEYDARKSGGITISHLRIGEKTFSKPYKIKIADILVCNQFYFLEKYSLVDNLKKKGILLINSSFLENKFNKVISPLTKKKIRDKEIKIYVFDADFISKKYKQKISFIIQIAFFYIMEKLEKRIFNNSKDSLIQDTIIADIKKSIYLYNIIKTNEPIKQFKQSKNLKELMSENLGDLIPVHKFRKDAIWEIEPTYEFEKREYVDKIPMWNPNSCIQCNKCVFVCPHGAIRSKIITKKEKKNIFYDFNSAIALDDNFQFTQNEFIIQISPNGCVGCELCIEVCPTSNEDEYSIDSLIQIEKKQILEKEEGKWNTFNNTIVESQKNKYIDKIKNTQFIDPLFAFSSACAGCGETAYLKLLTQLFGSRLYIANASGCSTVYCANLPSIPWNKDTNGKSVVWSHSLFENNAEFGFGLKLGIQSHKKQAYELLSTLKYDNIKKEILNCIDFEKQEQIVNKLNKTLLKKENCLNSKKLLKISDYLIEKSLWIIGGDGWAYDIGYGGIDHILNKKEDINILVLDNEGYANTGGHTSNSTPLGAKMKYSLEGKNISKKNLGLLALNYSHVYVASIAMGADAEHTLKVFKEAEKFKGPSIIIAYCPCITHGYNLKYGIEQQEMAVKSGIWPLYSFNPDNLIINKNPMNIYYEPDLSFLNKYLEKEKRFTNSIYLIELYKDFIEKQYKKIKNIQDFYNLK
ncbi:pyruvate:ferredoxin (flavodoxin) oxidoreductase [Malaciobacter mytili LMG 24559]|uniref:Pyruvate:ferredoxin (Flavodoxin) oxidoreductase n=1 Tax=Malaciobacter mytili LMG 24559 TaxID=1032238 RepID=A0AAX2ABL4_9BACT|nr:pyruvate:ferredoxin (flavodoxin) oxidoreductase [Malaciobacter mytili]AXH14482.1 pyruvate:ferredoxin (flavodoxin) oxidoreductase, homodimeric [Malaciobacter mytili LMG 24559]RXK12938.1 pyruvate:ferredoxin (flavodoxin) oxidoreductase [Malaciobacter mytili LMG 24559]